MEQIIIADGKTLWIYDVELEQVTVKKQEKSIGGMAGLFLSRDGNTVARDFTVTRYNKNNTEYFNLISKSNKSNFNKVRLQFVNNQLREIELFDQLGQDTLVKLKNIQNNPSLSAKLFQFKIPKGVDVVNQ